MPLSKAVVKVIQSKLKLKWFDSFSVKFSNTKQNWFIISQVVLCVLT
jgi:hypothetical protein